MKSIFKIGLLGLSILSSSFPLYAEENPQIQQIVENYTRLITQNQNNKQDSLLLDLLNVEKEQVVSDQNVEELFQKCPISKNAIDLYIAGLKADGSWKDINYQDTKRSGWEPKLHGRRVMEMAKYYIK